LIFLRTVDECRNVVIMIIKHHSMKKYWGSLGTAPDTCISKLDTRKEVTVSFRRRPIYVLNPVNAELNPICHLLALLGAHPILHVSRIRVKKAAPYPSYTFRYLFEYQFMWDPSRSAGSNHSFIYKTQ